MTMPDRPAPETGEWTGRVGSAWAEQWRRTDRSFNGLTARLLDRGALGRIRAALDVGCGAGEIAWTLAGRYPCGRVIGVDVSAELLAVARARPGGPGAPEYALADAARWQAPPGFAPDLVISRHGVMFFADPVAAFANLRRQCAPSALLRFSCFRAREDNRWYTDLVSVLPGPLEPPSPDAPGPFAFADPQRVRAILTAAGWRDVAFEAVDYRMIAGEGESEALDEAVAYFQRIGPAARVIAALPERARAAVCKDLRAMLATHRDRDRVSLPAAAWIVHARAPRGAAARSPLVTQRSIA
jgi:SAM-dependent methyltransferase